MRHLIESILAEHWKALHRYALVLTRDPDAARDLVQQAAVKALGSRSGPTRQGAERAWLFTILRNAWIDLYRHERESPIVPGDLAVEATRWYFDDRLLEDLVIRDAVGRLDILHREVLMLIDMQGFKYGEAAEILGIPIGTVMSRISRARLALLEIIGGNVRALGSVRKRRS